MSESDGNRKRAISSVSTEDGSTGTFAGPSGTNAGFTTYPTALAPSAPPPPPPPAATGGNKKRNKKGTRAASTAGAQVYLPPVRVLVPGIFLQQYKCLQHYCCFLILFYVVVVYPAGPETGRSVYLTYKAYEVSPYSPLSKPRVLTPSPRSRI